MPSTGSVIVPIDPGLSGSCAHAKIAVLSVIEVEDEAINHPDMYRTADPSSLETIGLHPDGSVDAHQGEPQLRNAGPVPGAVEGSIAPVPLTTAPRGLTTGRRR